MHLSLHTLTTRATNIHQAPSGKQAPFHLAPRQLADGLIQNHNYRLPPSFILCSECQDMIDGLTEHLPKGREIWFKGYLKDMQAPAIKKLQPSTIGFTETMTAIDVGTQVDFANAALSYATPEHPVVFINYPHKPDHTQDTGETGDLAAVIRDRLLQDLSTLHHPAIVWRYSTTNAISNALLYYQSGPFAAANQKNWADLCSHLSIKKNNVELTAQNATISANLMAKHGLVLRVHSANTQE